MKLCKNCETYVTMPIPDKDKPSFRAEIAPQSDADPYTRFVFVFPTDEGTLCYYCQKKQDKRIGPNNEYDNSYDQKNR